MGPILLHATTLVMENAMAERQRLIAAVNTLPEQALPELAQYLDYLHYKAKQPAAPEH